MHYCHFTVIGWVQGVGFREHTRRQARKDGLKGWVFNRTDGAVEIFCKGEHGAVDAFAAWLRHGPPMARVDSVLSKTITRDNPLYNDLQSCNSFSIQF